MNLKKYMKPIITNVKVKISNIEVDDRYYSFDYKIYINRKFHQEGSYDSDYESWKKSEFRSYLKSGGALKITLEQINFK